MASIVLTFAAVSAGQCADLPPTSQDLQIAGRVLKFQEARNSDEVVIAVAYDSGQSASAKEASAIANIIGQGLKIGDITLRGVLVEQQQLKNKGGFGAIFATTGVDPRLLQAAQRQHAVPCLSRDVELVTSGACTVAIQASPGVAIYFNSANAAATGLRFATAFVMMVHEL